LLCRGAALLVCPAIPALARAIDAHVRHRPAVWAELFRVQGLAPGRGRRQPRAPVGRGATPRISTAASETR
jgi:hypothetical protein